MKILIVIPSLTKGGAERVVSTLSNFWSNEHNVFIALFDVTKIEYSYTGSIIDINAPSSSNFFTKIINPFLRIMRLRKVMTEENFDSIFSFMESANFPTIISTVLSGNKDKLSVSIRNNPSDFIMSHQILMRFLYDLPKRVIPISKGVEIWLHNHSIALKNSICVNNPIDLELVNHKLRNIENDFNFEYRPYILAVGRLNYQKGFDLLINAFSELRSLNLNLLIYGEGQDREKLEKLIHDLGLDDRVFLKGLTNNIYSVFKSAEFFVLSSRYEGWGNVIMEAMSCKCPVISFDCDYGPRELITNGLNGILVSPNNTIELKNAIQKLFLDEKLRKKLIKNASRTIKHFDINLISKEWLYEEIKRQ